MSYAGLLDNRCNVSRTSQTADSHGGYTTTETVIYRRIPCRFNAMSAGDLSLYADRLGTLAGFVVFMEAGRSILEGDLLTKGDTRHGRNDRARQFDVKLVRNYDEQDRFLTLICAERARKVE